MTRELRGPFQSLLYEMLNSFPDSEKELGSILTEGFLETKSVTAANKIARDLMVNDVRERVKQYRSFINRWRGEGDGEPTEEMIALYNAYTDVWRYRTDIQDAANAWGVDFMVLKVMLRSVPPATLKKKLRISPELKAKREVK